jgi:hypothetical protein
MAPERKDGAQSTAVNIGCCMDDAMGLGIFMISTLIIPQGGWL